MSDDSPRLRLGIVGVVCVSLLATLLVRLWFLQAMEHQDYELEARSARVKVVHEEGARGRIFDRNGKLLVGNRVVPVIGIIRDDVAGLTDNQRAALYERLALEFNAYDVNPQKVADIKEKVNDVRYSRYDFIPLFEDAPRDLTLHMLEHPELFPGVSVRRKSYRVYPYGQVASNMLGYVGQINERDLADKKRLQRDGKVSKPYEAGDTIGLAGIERSFEDVLRGKPGKRVIEVSRTGEYIRDVPGTRVDAGTGDDLWLSFDVDLQAWSEHVLASHISDVRRGRDKDGRRFRAPNGATVVLDTGTGQVMAMASWPTYDPAQLATGSIPTTVWNRLRDDPGHPLNNWAIQGLYAPASTFKLFSATAALEAGFINPNTTYVDSTGKFVIPNCGGGSGCARRNAGGAIGGSVDVTKSITVSNDVFYYWIGYNLWIQRAAKGWGDTPIQDFAARFGLGERTGVDLPYESPGYLPTPAAMASRFDNNPGKFARRNWVVGDSQNTAIGQGDVLVTPLQLANAYATFANGGFRLKPQIASQVRRAGDPTKPDDTKQVKVFEPQLMGSVTIAPANRAAIEEGLAGVVHSGSGTANRPYERSGLSWRLRAKTGTAEKDRRTGKADDSVFVAYGPTDNGAVPKYTVAVIIPESGFGADTAAPTAFRILGRLAAGSVPHAPTVDEYNAGQRLPGVPTLEVRTSTRAD